MRIVQEQRRLTYLISGLEVGGAERGMARLVGGLDDEFEITVFGLRGGDRSILEEVPDSVAAVDLDITAPWDVVKLRRLWRELLTTDVLVCSLYHAVVIGTTLGRLAGVPSVLTWRHNLSYDARRRSWLYGGAIRWSDAVLADSDAVATMLERDYGLDPKRIHRVPLAGVDLDRFAPDRFNGPSDPDSGDTVVGTMGRLVPEKNHRALLDVAARLRDAPVSFRIAGDGPRRAVLERRITERDLDAVTLVGHVDAPDFLDDLDLYVQPSLTEGLCISAIEAAACGLPVVASAVGGLTESVVDGRTGYLTEPDDVDALTERIAELMADPELRRRMGRRGRSRVEERYSRQRLLDTFRGVLARTAER